MCFCFSLSNHLSFRNSSSIRLPHSFHLSTLLLLSPSLAQYNFYLLSIHLDVSLSLNFFILYFSLFSSFTLPLCLSLVSSLYLLLTPPLSLPLFSLSPNFITLYLFYSVSLSLSIYLSVSLSIVILILLSLCALDCICSSLVTFSELKHRFSKDTDIFRRETYYILIYILLISFLSTMQQPDPPTTPNF